MSWPQDFIIALKSGRYEPRYTLEWVSIPFGVTRPHGGNIRISSFETSGFENIITTVTSSFMGGDLRVRDWTCSPCTFDVGLTGELQRGVDVRVILQRGQGVVLKVGFGDDPTQFQPVALGAVTRVRRSASGWVIRCRGLEGSLASRIAIAANEQKLGWDLASTTTTQNVLSGSTSITVTSLTGFRTDGQGVGVAQITADDGTLYYVTYTGTSSLPPTLTGVTVAVFDTTHSTTTSGATITEVMYTSAHPLKVMRRILTSTGTGNNGPDDILPESWGIGIPNQHVADLDILTYINKTQPASGTAAWHWVQPDAIEDPQAAIASWGAGGGFFLTQRRGQITARAGLRPWLTEGASHMRLTDDLIIPSTLEYEAWDPDQPVEYLKARLLYGEGSFNIDGSNSETDHIPARTMKEHTLGGIFSDSTNESAISTEIVNRIGPWDIRVPEKIMVDLNGWWPGVFGPGDTVSVELSILTGRSGLPFVPGLITRCFPDWFGAMSRIEISILPVDEWVVWAPGRV